MIIQFGYRIEWEGGWSFADNGLRMDFMLADLAKDVDITTVKITVVMREPAPSTLAEAMEKGRRDYMRVTGQSE